MSYRQANGRTTQTHRKPAQCDKCKLWFKRKEVNPFRGEDLCGACMIGDSEEEFVRAGREEFYGDKFHNRTGIGCHTLHVQLSHN